jgi:hypothetical protein
MSVVHQLDLLDPSADWTRRYEELRQQASVQPGWTSRRWGLALLIGRGVVAWMRAWPQRLISVERQQTHAVPNGPELPSHLHHQVTLVLTNMILNGGRASLEATA